MKRLIETPSPQNLLAVTLAGLSFTIAFAYVFGLIHRAMAPFTIVDLEFAWTPARLAEMTTAWGAAGDAAARQSLWVDYLFMPVYVALAAGLVLITARASAGGWRTAGLWLTLAPFGAWACDALENAMLLTSLPPAAPAPWALTVAGLAAAVKFGLLAVGLIYFAAALVRLGLARLAPKA
ncbi:MAG: hypothetical protein JNK29_09365 [Anaerolineales bacterium]|nr:hypothetical protein [Anaerolineales bacterium]